VSQHDTEELRIIESHLAKDRMDAAIDHYSKSRSDMGYLLIERTGRDKDQLGKLATLFYKSRHFRLVAECFDQLGDSARSGQMYEKAGDPANAAEMYWKAKVFARAAICYEASGSFTKAGELWLRLSDPLKAGMAFERAGAIFRAGECLLEAGRTDRAIPLLQQVPPDDFNFQSACLLAARGMHKAEMNDLAIRRLEMGIGNSAISADNAELFYERAVIQMADHAFDQATVSLQQLASWNFSYKDVGERLKSSKAAAAKPTTATVQNPEEFDDGRVRAGIDVLQQHPLLAGLTLPQMRVLYDGFDRKRIAKGETLIEAGQPSKHLYILIQGTASVMAADGSPLAELGSGSWFGEMTLVDDGPASAKVRATSGLAVLCIAHDDFSHLLETRPGLAASFYRHFAQELARRLRAANDRVG
jgi:tetratricopeptide (TPR) repeat protein